MTAAIVGWGAGPPPPPPPSFCRPAAPILAGIITAAIVGWWRNRK
ncbi:type I toxin-antitoxin system toxin Ldr family protein [Escherichia coli]